MKTKNLNICTWNEQADCQNCSLQEKLACKWDKKILSGFHGIAWPPLLIIIFGIVVVSILTKLWWLLPAYLIYFFLMFGILEIRFLCSHCPYYAEEGKILHCLANHGSFKFWSYRPGPLNKLEKFMMVFLIITIFFLIPLIILGYGIAYLALDYTQYGLISLLGLCGIAGAIVVTSISFVITLKTFFCPSCVNFSCPLNSVPKAIIDAYLTKNDVMKKAWEEAGWQIG
jgi:hypothetical protein